MADKKNLLLLFDRPGEPVFTPKGKDNAVFQMPSSFLEERFQAVGANVMSRFGEDAGVQIPVQNMDVPDLSVAMQLGKQENFSLFVPKHREIGGALAKIFLKAKDVNQLQSYAVYARDRVNPQLFNYALSVAILHRPDTKDLDLPLFIETFPSKFIESKSLIQARQEASVIPEGSRRPIIIPRDYTASDKEPEHKLWYFREDLGTNLHHWHWHIVYPFSIPILEIVDKDRRGELFYYMHKQILARYNFERFSNDLPRVVPLRDFRTPIAEGYFPKLDSLIASRSYPPRASNVTISDINREQDLIILKISDLELWRDRIIKAIDQGYAELPDGQQLQLSEERGIDILGNMVEASLLTPNEKFYGDLHNMLHFTISYQHDPDHRHLESFGVIGDSTTAMRDPVFYPLHACIDEIFQMHKAKLPSYTTEQLTYPGINVTGIELRPDNGRVNQFSTFWQLSDVNLARGMDFQPRGDVFVRLTHLQHIPFTYVIQVTNDSGESRLGMARIFMSPKTDEKGQAMSFNEQRHFFIELDKFAVNLRAGHNTIKRRSTESTLTIPYERTFRNLDSPVNTTNPQTFNFCGCGWPQHMLVPKGTAEGLAAELFIMISNYEEDRVEQELTAVCNDAASFCGIRDSFYPDKKAMGYPFDRNGREGAENLKEFLTPNMFVQDVSIVFTDRTVNTKN